jgi:hypothetical protein
MIPLPARSAGASCCYQHRGAIELWFDEPINVAKLAIRVEAQGRDVEIARAPVAVDDEGFARSVLISPRTEWPASEVTLQLENATDLAGNTRDPDTEDVRLPAQVVSSRPTGP